MALIHSMLNMAHVYVQFGEGPLAVKELERALVHARSLRQTRRVRIVRAHIIQCIERAKHV